VYTPVVYSKAPMHCSTGSPEAGKGETVAHFSISAPIGRATLQDEVQKYDI
jgi:hypothetical protein